MKTLKLAFDLLFAFFAIVGVWTCWPFIGPCISGCASAVAWAIDSTEEVVETVEIVSSPTEAASGMVETAMGKTVEACDAIANDMVEVSYAVAKTTKKKFDQILSSSPIALPRF